MAGARILFPEFRDEQSTSRYPFADTATLQNETNPSIQIATTTFTDAVFFIIGGFARVYISSVVVTPQNITIVVGDVELAARAFATYSPLTPPQDGVLAFTDQYNRPAGLLISTPTELARFAAWGTGAYEFTLAQTEFVSSVVIPAREPGVRAIQPETKQFLTGDIWLVGDQGVLLRQDGPGIIRVDIIGVPLFRRFLCEPRSQNFPTKRYLKTINDCGPDEFGSFTFTATNQAAADTVLRVYADNGTIVIDTIGRSVV
jgi:hypothetical protein